MSGVVIINVDNESFSCRAGMTVATALLARGIYQFRSSPTLGAPRGPFCMMGACQECAILIDGRIQRACQTIVRNNMSVNLEGASA